MDGGEIDTTDAAPIDTGDGGTTFVEPQERNYDAEARAMGWRPVEEFTGDKAKFVEAKDFVERGEQFMPLLKKQNAELKREISDLKRDVKRSAEFFSKAEERAYNRALADLEAKHDEAVESGDVRSSKALRKEIDEIKADVAESKTLAPFDEEKAKKELDEWMDQNDWYFTDAGKRAYADRQAEKMGRAENWPDGNQAWLVELTRRVNDKFAPPKPNPVNGGGNRGAPSAGGKSFADLPPAAKALCDKWVKNGTIKSRDDYVKAYQWD